MITFTAALVLAPTSLVGNYRAVVLPPKKPGYPMERAHAAAKGMRLELRRNGAVVFVRANGTFSGNWKEARGTVFVDLVRATGPTAAQFEKAPASAKRIQLQVAKDRKALLYVVDANPVVPVLKFVRST